MLKRLAARAGGLLILLLGLVAAATTTHTPAPAPAGAPYERADVSARGVLLAGAGLVVLLLVAVAMTTWMMTGWTGAWPDFTPPATGVAVGPDPAVLGPSGRSPDENATVPRLQPAPGSDIKILRAREARSLSTWQWVDRSAGIAQIPIDVAMGLVAERGLPEFGTTGDGRTHGRHEHQHGPVGGQVGTPGPRP